MISEPRGTGTPAMDEVCVHTLIERQQSKTPNASAVSAHDGSLTYNELHTQASRLAQMLVNRGIGPETCVPFLFEKSKMAIVAILGILRAGAAFVPLDAAYPPDRLREIVEQVSAKVIVCSVRYRDLASALVGSVTILCDKVVRETSEPVRDHDFSHPSVQLANKIYVLFTSGSTGRPKGIIMEHGALTMSMLNQGRLMHFSSQTRMLQFASYAFDASIMETIGVLIYGGTVCIPSDTERLDDCQGFIRRADVNTANMTPSFAKLLDPAAMPGLKTLILGGESLQQSDIDKWASKVRLLNGFGPSEACVICTYKEVVSNTSPSNIGRPLGCRVWIVDRHDCRKLLPVGETGELCIQGPILAREYLHNKEQSTEAFVEVPGWAVDATYGKRMYKSGDLAMLDENGDLHVLGRKDSQLKLRGQRIDTSDIERNIWGAPAAVSDVAVELLSPKGKAPFLAAFLTFESEGHVGDSPATLCDVSPSVVRNVQSLEGHLKQKLPAYMVPRALLPLTKMPLTVSNKIDRKLLQEIGSSITAHKITELKGAGKAEILSLTNDERQLAVIWSDALGINSEGICPDDSFWDLGGDSLTAMQIVFTAQKAGIHLNVADIFAYPVLRTLALHTSKYMPPTVKLHAPTLEDSEERPAEIMAHFRWSRDQIQAVSPTSDYQTWSIITSFLQIRGNINHLILDFYGQIDIERLKRACRALIDRHTILRTVFVPSGRQLFQVVLRPNGCKFDVYPLNSQDMDVETSELIDLDRARPISFGDQMVHFMLVHSARRSRLIFAVSHAQYDGVCLPIIWKDLKALYEGSKLLSKPRSLHGFMSAVETSDVSNARAFWQELLQGSSAPTAAIRRSGPMYLNSWNNIQERKIPFISLSARGITLSTIVSAAWAVVLGNLSSDSDVVFGYLSSGRNSGFDGLAEVVGACANLLAMRLKLDPSARAIDLLNRCQDMQVRSTAHDFMGWQHVIEQCTAWPSWTRFSTVVHHRNIGNEPSIDDLGGIACEIGFRGQRTDRADLWVESFVLGAHLHVQIISCDKIIPQRVASEILERLCAVIQELVERPDDFLNGLDSCSPRHSPLFPIRELGGVKRQTQPSFVSEVVSTASSSKRRVLEVIIDRIWGTALAEDKGIGHDIPFYEIWGSLLGAVQLHVLCRREGLPLTVEDVVENPTKRLQLELIERRANLGIR